MKNNYKESFEQMRIAGSLAAKTLDENGGIELKFRTIPCLAITVGHLAGAWVRCEGKPVKVSVERVDDFDIIQLKSKYEMS